VYGAGFGAKENRMNLEQEKEIARKFLVTLEKPDAKFLGEVLADNFEFEMMGRLPGITPIRGKEVFIKGMTKTMAAMFPNGLNIKIHTVIAESNHVAIQAESDTVAGTGKKYANRYHFYFRFDGDKIGQVREYNDVNHVREVFMS
jgi:ketosteroid isomerase-like protein